jgi:hypothetical protein
MFSSQPTINQFNITDNLKLNQEELTLINKFYTDFLNKNEISMLINNRKHDKLIFVLNVI